MVALFQVNLQGDPIPSLAIIHARKGGRSHVCMRCTRPIKRREVIGSVSANCYLLKHNSKVWPFPKVYSGDGGEVGRGQFCLCSLPPESMLAGLAMVASLGKVASHLLKSVISRVTGYYPPLTDGEIKFLLHQKFSVNETRPNNRINMSLQTIGISWKHALVFFY